MTSALQAVIGDREICLGCGGQHVPDSPDTWVQWGRWRFYPPFYCLCCGREICARQFAYGKCCGICDMGACDPNNSVYRLEYAHEHPSWWRPFGNRDEMWQAYVEAVGGVEVEIPTLD